jgi:hypothetical protein
MKFRAEKNFKCNNVSKKKGDSISDEEIKKMGEFAESLMKDGFILGDPKDLKPVKKEAPKKTEKKPEKKDKKLDK